jgi:hypothetical protein
MPSRPRARRGLALLPALLVAVLLLAGCSVQGVKATTQTEEALTAAGIAPESVYVNVEPVAGGVDQAEGDHTIQIELTYTGQTAAGPGLAEKAAEVVWKQSIAPVDTVLVRTREFQPDQEATRFTTDQLQTRFGPRPAGVEQVDRETLEREDANETKGLFAFVALLPVLFFGGLVLLVILVAVVVIVLVARSRRKAAPRPEAWPAQGPPYRR